MISDEQLYQIAVFLGSCAMLLIVLYHYLEVNAKDLSAASSSILSSRSQPVQSRALASSPKNAVHTTSIKQDAPGGGWTGNLGGKLRARRPSVGRR
ncbi:hypothetical protein ACJ73_05660 [Blastomyces percursus]|uniref:Dolichyl-diphosphooligosaccharide--protein glycosyltransferase subunit 4 n=1 Tax=Blastomyces percursus TaxID=1658174 RepID=A0A1J9QS00_9EURO|nr:hypothetical protein ACJ73_05660 [Blastomyces percursus]